MHRGSETQDESEASSAEREEHASAAAGWRSAQYQKMWLSSESDHEKIEFGDEAVWGAADIGEGVEDRAKKDARASGAATHSQKLEKLQRANTLLCDAAMDADDEGLVAALGDGANVSARDPRFFRMTALHIAAQQGHIQVLFCARSLVMTAHPLVP
jgi:hypothetical protein